MATITVDNPMTGIESASTSTVYVGEFAQAASPNFDMKCFPFDRKEVVFRITLQRLGVQLSIPAQETKILLKKGSSSNEWVDMFSD